MFKLMGMSRFKNKLSFKMNWIYNEMYHISSLVYAKQPWSFVYV